MAENRRPSAEADRRLRAAEAHFSKRIQLTGLGVAGGIVLAFATVQLGVPILAKLCAAAVFFGIGRVIYLIVQWRRTFYDILLGDGMTRKEAAWEHLRRYS
jgi:hypothetical protein